VNRLSISGGIFKIQPEQTGELPVTLQPRIEELKRRHASLDEAIEGEVQRPSPDQAAIAEMKKQKLRLKEEINVMENA